MGEVYYGVYYKMMCGVFFYFLCGVFLLSKTLVAICKNKDQLLYFLVLALEINIINQRAVDRVAWEFTKGPFLYDHNDMQY